jgi:hypothetical protein
MLYYFISINYLCRFIAALRRVNNRPSTMLHRQEKHKYLEPKSSKSLDTLADYLKEHILMRSDAANKSTSKVVNISQKSDKSAEDVQVETDIKIHHSNLTNLLNSHNMVIHASSREARFSASNRVPLKPETLGIGRPSTHHRS